MNKKLWENNHYYISLVLFGQQVHIEHWPNVWEHFNIYLLHFPQYDKKTNILSHCSSTLCNLESFINSLKCTAKKLSLDETVRKCYSIIINNISCLPKTMNKIIKTRFQMCTKTPLKFSKRSFQLAILVPCLSKIWKSYKTSLSLGRTQFDFIKISKVARQNMFFSTWIWQKKLVRKTFLFMINSDMCKIQNCAISFKTVKKHFIKT